MYMDINKHIDTYLHTSTFIQFYMQRNQNPPKKRGGGEGRETAYLPSLGSKTTGYLYIGKYDRERYVLMV